MQCRRFWLSRKLLGLNQGFSGNLGQAEFQYKSQQGRRRLPCLPSVTCLHRDIGTLGEKLQVVKLYMIKSGTSIRILLLLLQPIDFFPKSIMNIEFTFCSPPVGTIDRGRRKGCGDFLSKQIRGAKTFFWKNKEGENFFC